MREHTRRLIALRQVALTFVAKSCKFLRSIAEMGPRMRTAGHMPGARAFEGGALSGENSNRFSAQTISYNF